MAVPGQNSSSRSASLCKYFQKGSCKYGARCKFRHTKRSVPAVAHESNDAGSEMGNEGHLAGTHDSAVACATASVLPSASPAPKDDLKSQRIVVDTGSAKDLIGEQSLQK
eukprot:1892978-Amphidinium_carterae.1